MSPSVVSSSSRRSVLRPLLLSLLSFFLALTVLPSRAAIDLRLNTSSFVPGQQSELSIDGVVTPGGASRSLTGALVTLRFAPSLLSVSNLRAAPNTGWTLQAMNTDNAALGEICVVLTNSEGNTGEGQTTTGPLLVFTATPRLAGVDLRDCDTLRLDAVYSSMSDQDYAPFAPSDACGNGGMAAPLDVDGPLAPEEGGLDAPGATDCAWPFQAVFPDAASAVRALRIAGGLQPANCADVAWMDQDDDGRITLRDAVALLRLPTPIPQGWYTYQGDSARTGRSFGVVSPTARLRWASEQTPQVGGQRAATGVAAVVDPCQPSSPYPVVYATVASAYASRLYCWKDSADAPATGPVPASFTFSADNTALPDTFRTSLNLCGPPLVVGNAVVVVGTGAVVGNVYTSSFVMRVDTKLSAAGVPSLQFGWGRAFPVSDGLACIPAYSSTPTQYTVACGAARSAARHTGGCVLAPILLPYTDAQGNATRAAFLTALSLDTGKNVWGVVDADGHLVPTLRDDGTTTPGGLRPLGDGLNSVSVAGQRAYVSTWHTIAAVNLTTGVVEAGPVETDEDIAASLALFDGKMYFGRTGTPGVMEARDLATLEPVWEVPGALSGHALAPFASSPAIRAETETVVFNDIEAYLYGVGADALSDKTGPQRRWQGAEPDSYGYAKVPDPALDEPAQTNGNPLIAGALGAGNPAYVFLAGEDGRIYSYNADTGAPGAPLPNNVLRDTDGQPFQAATPIHNAMAAFGGRLYALSDLAYSNDDLRCTLYCFGTP